MSGGRRRKTKGHYYGAFSVFLFAQKQSIYSSVLQHKYIRKELYYILLGTKKKMWWRRNWQTFYICCTHWPLYNYFITAMSRASLTQRYNRTWGRGGGDPRRAFSHPLPQISNPMSQLSGQSREEMDETLSYSGYLVCSKTTLKWVNECVCLTFFPQSGSIMHINHRLKALVWTPIQCQMLSAGIRAMP